MEINKFAATIIILALVIAIVGVFLYEDMIKANPNIINSRASQNTQPRTMSITIRRADNTTETIEANAPTILVATKE